MTRSFFIFTLAIAVSPTPSDNKLGCLLQMLAGLRPQHGRLCLCVGGDFGGTLRRSRLRLLELSAAGLSGLGAHLLQERKPLPLGVGNNLFRLRFRGRPALPGLGLHLRDFLNDFQGHPFSPSLRK